MKPDPIVTAVESALQLNAFGERAFAERTQQTPRDYPLILLSPQGRLFNQALARELSRYPRLALICGHYEGVDDRVREILDAQEISVGDYVLTGGEIPAMVIVDAVSRYIAGVVGHPDAPHQDSHATGLLEYPQYTRPLEFRGRRVPEILLSGHHGEVARWRRREALRRTLERRPDLLARAELTEDEKRFLRELGWQAEQ